MYSTRFGLTIGFHGCDQSVVDKIVSNNKESLKASSNSWDWLGEGIYFWENNMQRALEYAQHIKDNPQYSKHPITKPAVLGAVIDLRFCLDLLDSTYIQEVKQSYNFVKTVFGIMNMPENKKPLTEEEDILIRRLDCVIINNIHALRENNPLGLQPYDSIRGVFMEGRELYPNAGFKEKNHIQMCIRNPNCIKGYFLPREKVIWPQ